jgi:hypothetical protein
MSGANSASTFPDEHLVGVAGRDTTVNLGWKKADQNF